MTTTTKLDKSRIEIKSSVPANVFANYKTKALENIGKRVKIDGFREGNVPANILESKVGAGAIMDEMAQLAIMDTYPKILADEKIDAIGLPQISITKIAEGNDLEFTITTAVAPTVKLGDYKKIARDANKNEVAIEVTDEEIANAIKDLRQMRAHHLMHEQGIEHQEHDHTRIAESDLPELTDEFVKTLGKFESVDDFKEKLKENLAMEKKNRENEKNRVALIDGIIDASTIELPDALVDFELDKMMQQFAYDISMMGHTFDNYLKKIEKTETDLKTEWRVNAEKRAKMQLILDKVATDENLAPTDSEIQTETQKILEMYADQHDIAEDRVRAYVTQILTNAKAFEYLEGLK